MSLTTAFTIVFQPDRAETADEVAAEREREAHERADPGPIEIRTVGLSVIGKALRGGIDDLRHSRSETLTIAVIYPLCGLIVAGVIADRNLEPFLFPVLSGFALIGPIATLWYAALSRQRERTGNAVAEEAIEVLHSAHGRALKRLAGVAILLFLVWNGIAALIFELTLGTSRAETAAPFPVRVFTTGAGWDMVVIGCAVGLVFAVITLAIGCISFPLALDRPVSASRAMAVSARAMVKNPVFMACWGAIIVAGLVLGAIPALIGLAVVLPVLGHATWHIYREVVV